MTCQEFWRIVITKDPKECTLAEIGAVTRHAMGCPTCDKELKLLGQYAEKAYGPISPEEDATLFLLAMRAEADPENR